jgi:hypothetical protein
MKSTLCVFLLLIGLSQASLAESLPQAPENRAVTVRFFGGLTGFDHGAYRAIKSSMASLIVDGLVNKFITTTIGLEGGSEFCVELNSNPDLKVATILEVLKTIKPSQISIYSFEEKVSCSED